MRIASPAARRDDVFSDHSGGGYGRKCRQWESKANGAVGNSVLLLGAQDTLDGLGNGLLALDQGRYQFALLDSSTSKIFRWKSASGVSKFAVRDAAQAADGGADAWANTEGIPREKATCYWTGALLRN